MTELDLDSYRCTEPPQFLWRVTHSGSQSSWLNRDMVSSNDKRTFKDSSEFKEAVCGHSNWNSCRRSCFMSAFSDYGHAWNWAQQRKRRHKSIRILKIDVAQLSTETCLFNMAHLISELRFTYSFPKHEYLILHRIPAQAMVDVEFLDTPQYDVQAPYAFRHNFMVDYELRHPPVICQLDDSSDEGEDKNEVDELNEMMQETNI
ncbi:hypothetical protein FDECE_4057 [Fusarium decemcellulare]|nr:hypothetical protein FDECE_4057 [Fusarium decemcellulare]